MSPVQPPPQVPPQPSSPHSSAGLHCGRQQVPAEALQVCGDEHVPHTPPHPSEPHCLPEHDGVQHVLRVAPVITQPAPLLAGHF